jgi:hypothetical protein
MLAGPQSAGLILLVLVSLLAFLFPTLPARAAYEEPVPEGQVVKRFVGLAYFQVWKHSSGVWQDTDRDGKPDRPGQVKEMTYRLADGLALGSGWRVTGARVRFPDYEVWSAKLYEQYGAYKGLDFEEFKLKILRKSAAKCREGRVWAEESGRDIVFHYEGIRLAGEPGVSDEEAAKDGGMDLKRSKNRSFAQSLGVPMLLPPGASFSDMAEGYIYWIPYLVEIYGEPAAARTPNFYVKDFDPGCPKDASGNYVAEAGKTYTATVTFGAKDLWPRERGYVVFPAVASVTGFHKAGGRYYAAELLGSSARALEGVKLAYAGAASVRLAQAGGARLLGERFMGYQAVLFEQDGAELRLSFRWTAQNVPEAVLGAAVNVLYPREGTPLIRPVWWEGGYPPALSGVRGDRDILGFVEAVLAVLEGSGGQVFQDNVAEASVKIALPDLYVKRLDPGTSEVEEGKKYSGTVVYGLKAGTPGPVRARLELAHNGYPLPGVDGQVVEFQPGQERIYTFSFTGQNRDSALVAKIRPAEGEDADWTNNAKHVVVPLKLEEPAPAGQGSLTFQAVSQTRTKTRPAGTAKWTDWVTATLKPPTPDPPRSGAWIEDWWIESASLSYPKKNPDFTIGCPYPPVGTRTVSMTVQSDRRTAKVEFQEDWALDGAPVYCLLEGRMMAETPKQYTITASYRLGYKYAWLERRAGYYTCYDAEGNPRTCSYTYYVRQEATGSSSGTVSGKLLVNGTGVDSRAQ